MPDGAVVGVPIYNEAENLPALLDALLAEPDVARVVLADDGSEDDSARIAQAYAARDARVQLASTNGHEGQLAGWVQAARAAGSSTIVFVDADALPEPGAVGRLARAVDVAAGVVAASGRVVAAGGTELLPRSRFSDRVLHHVRAAGYVKEALIGRFFAVDVPWFIAAVDRVDVIANDTYLSCRAARASLRAVYVADVACRYAAAAFIDEAAAQRQRADAGYAQLRELGLLTPDDEPPPMTYARALLRSALADPVGAIAWVHGQLYARRHRVYRTRSHAGTWETQQSTKRRLAP